MIVYAVVTVCVLKRVQLYASPKFLLGRPENHAFVEHLLDTINNLVQYQYEGNGHLVYALVRRRKAVEGVRLVPAKPCPVFF